MATIVVVEDNHALRRSLADYLSVRGHDVSEAEDAAELYGLMAKKHFEVAVVDVNLPHHDGFSITRQLTESTNCAVILTTVRDSVEDRVRGYGSGAHIYMIKPVQAEELDAAIRRLSSITPGPSQVLTSAIRDGWSLDSDNRRLWTPKGAAISLTPREVDALSRIASTSDQTVLREDLLGDDKLAGDDKGVRARVDSLVSRLRKKVLKRTGEILPLISIHNNGVWFTEPLNIL